jgi:hypothetical protein
MMKKVNFKYSKMGQKSDRQVLVIEEKDDFIAGIDFTHLTVDKANSLMSMAKNPTAEFNPAGYMDAFRKFTKKNMTFVKEEIL